MQSTNVRQIKKARDDQTFKGRRQVRCEAGRVIGVRTVKGQLHVRTLGLRHWSNVESVTIE